MIWSFVNIITINIEVLRKYFKKKKKFDLNKTKIISNIKFDQSFETINNYVSDVLKFWNLNNF
jgi:hypothetical protein